VQLKKEVVLDGLKVRLGDIAEVVSNDPKTSASISRLPVTELKTLLTPAKLDKAEVQKVLNNKTSNMEYSFVWGSEDSVSIIGKKRSIDLSEGADKAASWILGNQSESEIVALSQLRLTDMPMGKVEQRPNFINARRSLDKVFIPLEVFVDGILIAKPVLQFKVNGSQTRRDDSLIISHENKIQPSSSGDFTPKETDSKSTSSSPEAYVVKKDQKVQVVMELGLMHIESEGIALSSGNTGDEVTVQRIDNNELFIGVVSAPGIVTAGDS